MLTITLSETDVRNLVQLLDQGSKALTGSLPLQSGANVLMVAAQLQAKLLEALNSETKAAPAAVETLPNGDLSTFVAKA